MEKPNLQYRVFRRILRGGLKLMFKVNVTGLEHINQDENAVIVCNHNSWLDPLIVLAFFPNMKFGLMAEGTSALTGKWIGKLIETCKLNITFIDRGDPKSRLKGFYGAHKIIKKGESFLIFPEGRINQKDGKMYPFFMGAFSLAVKHEKKILPIFIRGNEQLYFRRRINFSVGEMISTSKKDNVEDLARKVYTHMDQVVKPELPENNHKKKRLEVTNIFLGEMAAEYDIDDIIIRANEATEIFNRVNNLNKDKYDTDTNNDQGNGNRETLVKNLETN